MKPRTISNIMESMTARRQTHEDGSTTITVHHRHLMSSVVWKFPATSTKPSMYAWVYVTPDVITNPLNADMVREHGYPSDIDVTMVAGGSQGYVYKVFRTAELKRAFAHWIRDSLYGSE